MSSVQTAAARFSGNEMVRLVASLHETQRRLQELAGGEVDAVIHPSGQTFLLGDAQEKLRQSEALERAAAMMQASILDALPAHIALINCEGVIMSVNEGWLRFAGSNAFESAAAGVGQNYLEICDGALGACGEEARQAAVGIRAVLSDAIRQFSMEYACHSPFELRYYRLMVTPIGESGKRGAVVMHVDITERKLSEDAVRESEERFRSLFANAAAGIGVFTPEGGCLQANGAYCKMLGYTEEELRKLDFAALIHPDDLPLDLKARDELLAGKRDSGTIEKRYLKKNGNIVWTRSSASALRGAGGEAKTLILVAEDITEQKMAAEEIRRSAALLSMASRVGRTGAWVVELPSFALTWSAGARSIHEVPPDFVPTIDTAIDFYTPEFRGAVREAVRKCEQKGIAFDFEAQIVTARATTIWVRVIGERVRSSGAPGVSTRIQGAIQDITDRKTGEEELTRMNRALKMLSNCNEALIWAESEQDLLDRICLIAVETGGYRMAWVGYASEDESRRVTPQAHAGVEEGYLSSIEVTWKEDEASGKGLAGRVIRSGQAEVCEDLAKDANFSRWATLALQHGYRGAIGLPLRDGDLTFGLFQLHSAEEKPTSADELKLLQELADNLAFGILSLRARTAKRRIEAAVVKVAASVSATAGTEFFNQLVRNMAEALGAQAAFMVQLLGGEPLTERVIAAVIEGRLIGIDDRPVKGTPGEALLTCDSCVIPKVDPDQFPNATILRAIGAQGYVGQRLTSSTGRQLGHLSVFFREPFREAEFAKSTLQIFAARAASELERRETETVLRDQARLLDVARDAIHLDDLDSRILYWNKGAQRTYGWNDMDALGQMSDEMLQVDTANVLTAMKTLIARGEWRGEVPKRTRDGRTISVDAHWTLVREENGKPKSILKIETDVTERKRLEEQFLRAQRLDSIGTLASGLAHDLNNILAPITMCAPLLRGDLKPEDKEKIVRAIELSASRGTRIIGQVLTFGRGIQGERKPIQIARIIKEIKQVADETFPKNIRVEPLIAAGISEIIGDATQLHQVLMNLCVNARDAMPDGGVLRITAENLEVDAQYANMVSGLSPGHHIVIEVADSGSGIPPEVAERIFDPFFTTKPIGKGTGLGLSTSLGIVKSHGGAISLSSRPGMGATFRIIVPASDDTELAATCETPVELARGNGEPLLIADDEEALRDAARTVLEMQGYRVLTAADGIEGMALYAKHAAEIDLVITDISMPLMDGIALIRGIRRMRPGLPIIASTGQQERVRELNILGLSAILSKPYTSELLLTAVDAALKASREEPARSTAA